MLDHEYGRSCSTQPGSRAHTARSRFFVFADTVSARNHAGTNECHGWLGMRFQTRPRAEPSDILMHVSLRDPSNLLQQQAVGILGVNLVHAAFHQSSDVETFLQGLFDGLSIARLEIDVIGLDGPRFTGQDQRRWCLELLPRKMAHAILFDARAEVVEPSSVLRKRPLLVMRGSFDLPEDFIPRSWTVPASCCGRKARPPLREPAALLELTTRHAARTGSYTVPEMLACVEGLAPRGDLAVTDFPETYRFSRYLRRYSTEPLRFILTVATVVKTLHEPFYAELPGALLEGVGRLLATNVRLYVAPMSQDAFRAALDDLPDAEKQWRQGGGPVTLDTLALPPPAGYLLDYLRSSGRILALPPRRVNE